MSNWQCSSSSSCLNENQNEVNIVVVVVNTNQIQYSNVYTLNNITLQRKYKRC